MTDKIVIKRAALTGLILLVLGAVCFFGAALPQKTKSSTALNDHGSGDDLPIKLEPFYGDVSEDENFISSDQSLYELAD